MLNFVLLEYLAFWEGRLDVSRLAKLLGCTREHAQRMIVGRYRDLHPDNLERQGRHLVFVKSAEDLSYAPKEVNDLLNMITHWRFISGEDNRLEIVPIEYLGLSKNNRPNAEIFRKLYLASAWSRPVRLTYISKKKRLDLSFSPHSIVRTEDRIHFRGYASWGLEGETGKYIDLVVSRVMQIRDFEGNYIPKDQDEGWLKLEDLRFRLNPDLPDGVRFAMLSERISEGAEDPFSLKISAVRSALASYVQRSLTHRYLHDKIYEVWIPDE